MNAYELCTVTVLSTKIRGESILISLFVLVHQVMSLSTPNKGNQTGYSKNSSPSARQVSNNTTQRGHSDRGYGDELKTPKMA